MKSHRFRRRVTRVIMQLVGVFETSFRQIFVFNEEASLQAASDTCHYATGRHVRGVVSSDFWRFFEYGGFLVGLFILDLGGFLSHSCHKQNENSLGERLGFLSFHFPVSFLRFLFLFPILCCISRVYFGQSGVVKFVI
jgi:hypothetical protein